MGAPGGLWRSYRRPNTALIGALTPLERALHSASLIDQEQPFGLPRALAVLEPLRHPNQALSRVELTNSLLRIRRG
jgi:hypothetical protein